MLNEKNERSRSSNQKIVVLGGSGFIGRALTKALASEGHRVVAVSRRPIPSQLDNLESVECDTTNFDDLKPLIEGADTVIQLVNGIHPRTGNARLIGDIEQELFPHIRLMDLCVKHGVGRLVFASSGGAVYGNADEVPTSEAYVPTPRNSYGLVKLTIEKYLELYQIEHGLDFVTLRVSNPYGPGQNFRRSQGFLVPSFIEKIKINEEITVFGDGTDTRDYIYIDDVVEAMKRAVQIEAPTARLFNIGGGAQFSINEMIHEIEHVLGREILKSHLPRRGSDIPRSFLDISRAKQHLGWVPQVSLQDGLTRVLVSEELI